MGLAGLGVPAHSPVPEALVLGFQLWVEAHQAESALRWKSVVPTSLFSKNCVKPIKSMELPHVGIFGCKEDGCSSFHPTSNTQIK